MKTLSAGTRVRFRADLGAYRPEDDRYFVDAVMAGETGVVGGLDAQGWICVVPDRLPALVVPVRLDQIEEVDA